MNKSFDKYKKRIWLSIIVKCVLAALCCAFLIVNIVLLPCLLNGVHLLWVWYLLIALAGLAAGGGVAFLLLRTDDGKIAKRLDAELNLAERVQTAYVYQGDSGVMQDLQRADAEVALSTANKLSFGNLVVTIVLAVVLAIGVCALPVIAVYADTSKNAPSGTVPPNDPPREVTDWEWESLDELIEYVRSSKKADDTAKSGMLTALNGLRNVLLGGVSQSSLTTFVRNTVTEIRNAVTAANESSGITAEQKQNNSDEEEYVINKLYEIFKLSQSGGSSPDPSGGDQKPEQPISPGNNTGTGELIINGLPFFDPELGYVSSGDTATRDKYYAIIQQAMLEGTISRSEWELIVAKYFADLKESEQNEED